MHRDFSGSDWAEQVCKQFCIYSRIRRLVRRSPQSSPEHGSYTPPEYKAAASTTEKENAKKQLSFPMGSVFASPHSPMSASTKGSVELEQLVLGR